MSQLPKGRTVKEEQALMSEIWDTALAHDLEAFVLYSYPWGKAGTPLEKFQGPRVWQRDFMQMVTDHIREQKIRIKGGLDPKMLKASVSSGRGIGKSALMSWLEHWMQSIVLGSSVIVSANTEDQLTKVTWGEFGIWHAMAINSHWFDIQATTIKPHEWFANAVKAQLKKGGPYYQTTQKIWSENNPNAFAGPHNQDGLMLLFDEASGIPEPIWNVAQGYFTEPVLHRYWFAFSQSRDNQSKFVKTFGEDDWQSRTIDARTVEGTDQALYQSYVDKHGEDGDVTRVEVRGLPPKQGQNQFISREFIDLAATRLDFADLKAPIIIGLDPARFGDDLSVIAIRQGRNARFHWIEKSGMDNMSLANLMAAVIQQYNPDAVCIDSGMGTGIIDRLRELRYRITEVQFGAASPDKQWEDFRTYIWAEMRDWLRNGIIPNNPRLRDDLAGPGYEFMPGSDRIKLESKKKMKARGIPSPDYGDALACTFAVKLPHKDLLTSRLNPQNNVKIARDVDYNIFG